MKQDMDKMQYRAYYYLAKEDEKKKLEKKKTIGDKKRIEEDIRRRTIFTDTLENQLIVKDKQLKKQLRVKDKQIAFLEKLIESRLCANQI